MSSDARIGTLSLDAVSKALKRTCLPVGDRLLENARKTGFLPVTVPDTRHRWLVTKRD